MIHVARPEISGLIRVFGTRIKFLFRSAALQLRCFFATACSVAGYNTAKYASSRKDTRAGKTVLKEIGTTSKEESKIWEAFLVETRVYIIVYIMICTAYNIRALRDEFSSAVSCWVRILSEFTNYSNPYTVLLLCRRPLSNNIYILWIRMLQHNNNNTNVE